MNKKIEQNTIHFISEQKLLVKGDKLLIALSGGPDSVFALHFFNKFKSKFGIDITAMHINHQLRGSDSEKDEAFCKTLCNKLNVNFVSVKTDVKKIAADSKQSIEEAARNIRYQKLEAHLSETRATKIVTAHNLDDNTETVLLNLFRGTGLKGAGGIPIKRGNIIRPFLTVSKKNIINYLNANEIEYRTDSTNFENNFARNYLRNEIIPRIKENINPGIDDNILRFSKIAIETEKAVNDYAQEISKQFINKNESSIEILNQIADKKFNNIFPKAIKLVLEEKFNKPFLFRDISKIKTLFSLQVGNKVELSNNIIAIKERAYVLIQSRDVKSEEHNYKIELNKEVKIGRETFFAETVKPDEVNYSLSNNVVFINGDDISFPLTIRNWKDGDRFQPFGLQGTKKTSDFLTDLKVSSINKKKQLVLLNKNKIKWVIGYRIDESAKIDSKTKKIIKISVTDI